MAFATVWVCAACHRSISTRPRVLPARISPARAGTSSSFARARHAAELSRVEVFGQTGPGLFAPGHLRACAVELVRRASNGSAHPVPWDNNNAHTKIDKSLLAISEPKRHRSKEHLRYVAQQPCLICERSPSHAHHLRFAQSKGLALKVSDEFTVPLCECALAAAARTIRVSSRLA